jgi:methylenetetrahydrofolate dehydrogenase (NADP+)/methenyltetrahydrofolate cyclohydrolase
MTAKIIDGKQLAKDIKANLTREVAVLKEKGITPTIALLLVGDDPASKLYVNSKAKSTGEIGGEAQVHHLPEDTTLDKIMALIGKLNDDDGVHGILVQLPLPEHLHHHEKEILNAIKPEKDVDAFHPFNIGNLVIGDKCFEGCTAAGCLRLIDQTGVDLKGKHAVVVGSTIEVGKPITMMLFARGAVVTLVHPDTPNLADYTVGGDLLVVEAQRPGFIKAEMIKPGAIVIDAGTSYIDGKTYGDVVAGGAEVAGWITPVPGGVGPMIIAMLMYNLVEAAK